MCTTRFLLFAQEDPQLSTAQQVGVLVILLAVIVVGVGLAIYFARRSKKPGKAGTAVPRRVPITMIQKLPPDQFNSLVNAIGAMVATRGYTPLGHGAGMYVYQKKQQANWALAILLMFLCLIPGLVYLVLGGSTKTVTMTVNDLGNAFCFNITGPLAIQNMIWSYLSPYSVMPSSDNGVPVG